MDFLITKFYEFLIKRKMKKQFLACENIRFEYSILVGTGFSEYYTKPNTMNRVSIYYDEGSYFLYRDRHKTFKNIKEAYYYFK